MVYVRSLPSSTEFAALAARARATASAFTTWGTAAEVLASKSESPPYTAVSEWLPTARAEVERVATPASRVALSMTVAPS
jgi:hypothetical protein